MLKKNLLYLVPEGRSRAVVPKGVPKIEPKVASNSTVDFLKSITPPTRGVDKKAVDKIAVDKIEEADTDHPNKDDKIEEVVMDDIVPLKESILPKKKQGKKARPIPKTNDAVPREQCTGPKQYDKTLQNIEIKLGQHFYCEESGILIVGKVCP